MTIPLRHARHVQAPAAQESPYTQDGRGCQVDIAFPNLRLTCDDDAALVMWVKHSGTLADSCDPRWFRLCGQHRQTVEAALDRDLRDQDRGHRKVCTGCYTHLEKLSDVIESVRFL